MNSFEKFIAGISGTMAEPQPYGWFHLMCFGLTIALAVLLVFLFRKASDKKVRIFLFVTSVILIVFEIYKQIVFSYNPSNDKWDYQWYAFPFQFCSVPMYVGLVASLCKKCKFRDFLYSFLGTYCLLAGALVMLLPTTVFVETIGINIQTMVHHGGMIVIGVVMLASKSLEFKHKTILKAMSVFGVLAATALLSSCIYTWSGGGETFNMFFISPYGNCELPVFDKIQQVSYPLFLFCYLFAFSLAAYIILLIAMLINKLAVKIHNKKQIAKTTAEVAPENALKSTETEAQPVAEEKAPATKAKASTTKAVATKTTAKKSTTSKTSTTKTKTTKQAPAKTASTGAKKTESKSASSTSKKTTAPKKTTTTSKRKSTTANKG